MQQTTIRRLLRDLLSVSGLLLCLNVPANADAPVGVDFYWGTPGTLPGELNSPYSLARATDGTIWVLNTGNQRVDHFTSDGTYLGGWALPPLAFGGSAFGMAIDSNNRIYITRLFAHLVQVFDAGGTVIREFGTRTTAGEPRGIAVLADGTCLVVNDERVSIFDANGQFIRVIGTGHFSRPWDIATDELGNIFVTDIGRYNVTKLDAAGNYLTEWSFLAPGQPVMGDPTGVVVRNGTVVVADDKFGRVIAYSTEGQYSWQVALPDVTPGNSNAIDLISDGVEGYFVLGWANPRVIHLGPMPVPATKLSWGYLKAVYR